MNRRDEINSITQKTPARRDGGFQATMKLSTNYATIVQRAE